MDTKNTTEQRTLFVDLPEDSPNSTVTPPDVPPIAGLQYIRDFIDQQKHDDLLCQIDSLTWLTDLKRRVQHYGYKYDYKSRSVNYTMRIGPLPQWAEELADILCERCLIPERPDQVIVNEYHPGQGIANHVDCVPCFTDTIVSLSLGSPCVMEFTNKETRQVLPLLLEPRSLVILQGEARFAWMHGIPARKTDQYQNKTIKRGRRVSLTFRKVILDGTEPPLECPVPPQLKVEVEAVQMPTASLTQVEACKRSMTDMLAAIERLRFALRTLPGVLAVFSEAESEHRPSPERWTKKEVVGHLIDSASNNHQRFVRGQLTSGQDFPGYEQEQWVRIQSYQSARWSDLIDLWRAYNTHLLHVAECMTEEGRRATCRVAGGTEGTLAGLFVDYVDHLEHHLRKMLVRWESGAA